MRITRTLAGFWVVRYRGTTYYTFTKDILQALQFPFKTILTIHY